MIDYTLVYRPRHPKANSHGYIRRHRAVAEDALGYYLPEGVEVHHVDGNKRNNATTNLVICQDHAYHRLLHVRADVVRAGGNPNLDCLCGVCKAAQPREAFGPSRHNKATGRRNTCRECELNYLRTYKPAWRARRRELGLPVT